MGSSVVAANANAQETAVAVIDAAIANLPVDAGSSDDDLLALLGELGDIPSAPVAATAPLVIIEPERPSMLADILATDTVDNAANALDDLINATPGTAPAEAAKPAETTPAKPKRGASKAKDKTEKPAKPAQKAAPAEEEPPVEELKPLQAAGPQEETPAPEKKASTPRQTFATKSEKIAHRLGDKASQFLILDTEDLELSEAELGEEQARVLALVDGMPIKVGEKATMLFNYLQHGGKLNEVMRRAFTVLIRDGFLNGGSKGNLISNLLTKPYSIGTASSQTTQMFALFPSLKITSEREGGQININPNSTILAKMKAELGL